MRRSSPLTTATDTGTRRRFSVRRSAVTTTSPKPVSPASGAALVAAGATPAVCAAAGRVVKATPANRPASRIDFDERRMRTPYETMGRLCRAPTAAALVPGEALGFPLRRLGGDCVEIMKSNGIFPLRALKREGSQLLRQRHDRLPFVYANRADRQPRLAEHCQRTQGGIGLHRRQRDRVRQRRTGGNRHRHPRCLAIALRAPPRQLRPPPCGYRYGR
ncbi:hypothetical protein SPHINGO8AM_160121 [Sphingomonas sp. 8AM]|nr:hypothetical protein SPHINGO8AM_160121 [Sphingomonas sp. 8AM]